MPTGEEAVHATAEVSVQNRPRLRGCRLELAKFSFNSNASSGQLLPSRVQGNVFNSFTFLISVATSAKPSV